METSYPGQPFLPHLPRLIAQLEERSESSGRRQQVGLQLEHLSYTLRGMETALEEFLLNANHILSVYAIHNTNDVALVRPFHRDRLNVLIDLFLDTARRAQNSILPYLRQRYGVNTPNSINDFMKKLAPNEQLPQRVTKLVLSYWHSHGRKLKDYRDLAQHHAIVASDARIYLAPSGRPVLYLTLPNNPDVKSAARLAYANPVVHASIYLETEFVAFIRFCHALVLEMLDLSVTPKIGVSFRFKDPLSMAAGAPRHGAIIPTVPELESRFTALLTELNAVVEEHDSRHRSPPGEDLGS
jgi:hypothetical protein